MTEAQLRLASPADAMGISLLYQQVYQGTYSNPLMRDIELLMRFLADPTNLWVVASLDGHFASSVVYESDPVHRIARAFGGAVLPQHRGYGLLERGMIYAQEHMMKTTAAVDVVYATTRTSTPAPQIVTEKLGYRKLGVFPNVHKTDVSETHCLTALYAPGALASRFTNFGLHPGIASLYAVVRGECDLPVQPPASSEEMRLDDYNKAIDLELIAAEKYALHRFQSQKSAGLLQSHFYPFHTPNAVISSPCQTVELFVFIGPDKYCTIIGIKKPREFDFTKLLETASKVLQNVGVRYIEILVRADKAKTIERVLKARFIPCAYFPAFQLSGGQRFDFVVLSRTFEIVDFRDIKLAGKNRTFVDEYLKALDEYYLKPQLPR